MITCAHISLGQKLPLDATLDDGFPSTSNQHPDDDMLQAAALGVNTSASLLMRDGNTLEKRLNPITMPPTVRVVMGNDPAGKSLKDFRQHVGLKFGDELRKDIKTGLSALCPWGQTSCPTDGVDPWKIEPIYYTTKNHELASNAHLNLRIIKSSFPEGYFGLREILIDAVAGAYGAISATDQNCYDAWATGEKKHMCNVVDFVGVEIAHWYGRADELQDPGASLFVTLTSSGATKKGKFDCIGSQTPVHNFLDSDKTGDKIADILGAARTSMGRRVDCPHTGVIERGIIPAPVTSLEKRTTNTVHLGIGNEKSHIGVLVGQNLGAAIRHGLDILCPPGQGGFDTCHKDPYLGMTDIARIGHDHGATDNKYSDDASMKMWVTTSYWPADRYEGMREALVSLSHRSTFCNITNKKLPDSSRFLSLPSLHRQ